MTAIAIDGPAGAGKSTIAKQLAKDLGYIYVDTGALYRAVGYYMDKQGVDLGAEDQVVPRLGELTAELKYIDGEQRVLVNGEDVTQKIRTPKMSMAASKVSALPAVRDFLFELQRKIARENDVIMDGRDIGTVVLPDAQVKIYLTASPQERARRRHAELLQKGEKASFEEVLADIVERDYNDSHRAVAPLRQAQDAILVDTTHLDLEKSVERIHQLIKERQSHVDRL
ncbi:(d)CMP kinase [Merdimmobilis hominis]|uniref:Cytidylate kinase n=1 Tax=uncultured Anaerotruncus sp. TaxID=905011 RepID=A0A6N2R8S9_9FIRM|nr:(d)CMP kinase [Merdimmobilis hominis]MCD4836671.1 (d)CMP kinase [Merdimmobilis hominis]PWL57801.1 MAG: (d)CMP kinase [Oscillospiraceae bacterium]